MEELEKENLEIQQEQLENNEAEEVFNVYEILNAKTGIPIEGEFEESPDGILEWANKFKAYEIEKQRELKKQENPILYELEELASKGGNIFEVMENIVNNVKGKISFDENNIGLHKEIVLQELVSKNDGLFTEEELRERVNKLEDEGKLSNYAKNIIEKRNSNIEQKNKQVIEENNRKIEQYNNIVNNNLTKIVDYINNGKLGDALEIPLVEREKLINWIDEQGLDADEQGRIYAKVYINSPEDLQPIFYKYRNGNINDLIKIKASTQVASKIFNNKNKPQQKQDTTGNPVLDALKNNSIIK